MDVAPVVMLVSMHHIGAPIHPIMRQERCLSSRPLASVCLCVAYWVVLAAFVKAYIRQVQSEISVLVCHDASFDLGLIDPKLRR